MFTLLPVCILQLALHELHTSEVCSAVMPLATCEIFMRAISGGRGTDGKTLLLLQTKQQTADAAAQGQEFAKHSKQKVRLPGAANAVLRRAKHIAVGGSWNIRIAISTCGSLDSWLHALQAAEVLFKSRSRQWATDHLGDAPLSPSCRPQPSHNIMFTPDTSS